MRVLQALRQSAQVPVTSSVMSRAAKPRRPAGRDGQALVGAQLRGRGYSILDAMLVVGAVGGGVGRFLRARDLPSGWRAIIRPLPPRGHGTVPTTSPQAEIDKMVAAIQFD